LKRTISFTDGRGRSHNCPEAATVSDLAALFDKDPNGVATDFAQKILSKRKEIERIFEEHDEAVSQS
jgi:sulfur carrier protein ThiS